MKRSLIKHQFIGLITVISLFVFKTANAQVKGWYLAGSYPAGYSIGVENSAERNGHVAFIKSVKLIKEGQFGTIMQSFIPQDYLGKRVKLTGYIKADNVKGWTGMWFRIDGEPRANCLGFDNMFNRQIKGTPAWKK